ncbi:MAG TPA: hypothetical protein VFC65_12755 [Prolixibacteraceae bacterium]|nr:hypothetical protein [Prolixibacteraceae bacterium]
MKETIILFFLFICFSCSVQKNNAQIKSDYIIPESYKEYNVVTKDHVLVLTKSNETTPKMPVKILEVVFYDTKTNEEFFKDQLRNGSLTWLNDSIVRISFTPGNPEKGTDYSYNYNLKTRKRLNNKNILNQK